MNDAGYVTGIWSKYTAKWGVQIAGMNFKTRLKRERRYL
ncbi:MAG: DUF6783 domain-containing protein [Clostridiales bacterium]|nr:DUF6783 domain-containing protein [Clostridiales bacterium]